MLGRLAVAIALTCAGCASSSGSTGADGGRTGANGQPCAQYELCVASGSVFNCDCGGPTGVPACPANTQPGAACGSASTPGCMGCSQGATFGCTCSDAGVGAQEAGGPTWNCVGGGQACR